MTELQKFLAEYKRLEEAIRNADNNLCKLSWVDAVPVSPTVLSLEDEISDPDMKDKLKLCRNVRNYAQHHSDNFASSSPAMTAFVSRIVRDIDLLDGSYKDIMTKCPVVLMASSTVKECADAFSRTDADWYPVTDSSGVGYITKDSFVRAVADGVTARTKIKNYVTSGDQSVRIELQANPISNMSGENKIVVINGKGKIVGIVN